MSATMCIQTGNYQPVIEGRKSLMRGFAGILAILGAECLNFLFIPSLGTSW